MRYVVAHWFHGRYPCLEPSERKRQCMELMLNCPGSLQRRVLWVAVLWWLCVLGYGYFMWISKGCEPYMPFISDMGLNAHVPKVFLMGTMVEGLLISSWLLWATLARSHILKLLRLRFVALEALCVLCGASVALGTFFIGVFPWDVYSYLHFACASGVFWGGCFYSFFTCLLCLGISCEYPLNLLGTRSRWRMMYTWLTPLCGFCLLAVFLCLFAAYDTRPEFFSWTWWPEIQASAREDFLGYCSGRSWHGLPWVNSCAFWEWATLMLLFVSMLAGQADIELYLDLKGGTQAELLPFDRLEGSELLAGRWRSPLGTLGSARCWWLALVLGPPSVFALMYFIWVHGCSPLPPLLSHFGLNKHTSCIFCSGLLFFDSIFAIWLLHLLTGQWATAQRRDSAFLLLSGFQATGASLMVVGFGGIGFVRWDLHLALHALCGLCILIGFGLWSTCELIGTFPELFAKDRPRWHRPLRLLQYLSWGGTWFALFAGGSGMSFQAAVRAASGWAWLPATLSFVHEDFAQICSGGSPTFSWSHYYALCQWMWMGCMHCFVACSICDSEVYFLVSKVEESGQHRSLRPPLRMVLLLGIAAAGLFRLIWNTW
ncbi:unnamed protein product [Durusdinium trenchii]|uniref:Uncharacterized protein n=2 Tax=Durusdinium trenchii TaxID=1381693 RepID=A0ABP0QU41_9DINO